MKQDGDVTTGRYPDILLWLSGFPALRVLAHRAGDMNAVGYRW